MAGFPNPCGFVTNTWLNSLFLGYSVIVSKCRFLQSSVWPQHIEVYSTGMCVWSTKTKDYHEENYHSHFGKPVQTLNSVQNSRYHERGLL